MIKYRQVSKCCLESKLYRSRFSGVNKDQTVALWVKSISNHCLWIKMILYRFLMNQNCIESLLKESKSYHIRFSGLIKLSPCETIISNCSLNQILIKSLPRESKWYRMVSSNIELLLYELVHPMNSNRFVWNSVVLLKILFKRHVSLTHIADLFAIWNEWCGKTSAMVA